MKATTFGVWVAVILLLSCGTTDASFSQPNKLGLSNDTSQKNRESTQEIRLNRGYWKGYPSEAKSILSSLWHWEKSDWLKGSLIVGITIGLYSHDQKIQEWAQRNRTTTSDEIAKFAKPFGDAKYILPALGMFYLYGTTFKDKKAQRSALLSLESFIVSGIFTTTLKLAGHRHRPSSGDPYDTWDGPSISTSNLSFPSGHSSSAFALASVVASEYDENPVIPFFSYGIATLTALSRVNDNAHWASDVFFGSTIGYFTGKAIVNLHRSEKARNLTILPAVNDEQVGLLVSYKF